ncbi:MAG: HNH endonuclease [Candidatus Latescibacteria bacterium]|nr:HNH endonuclease [Candidatus Latescibacterota bacterium]
MPVAEQLSFHFPTTPRREVEVKCLVCDRPFHRPEWYVKTGSLRLNFCSPSCRDRWSSEIPKAGPEAVILNGRPEYRGGDWDVTALRIRERDGYTCQVCGITEKDLGKQLDVHHIIPYRLFQSNLEANRPSNLIAVCHSCHIKLEAEGERTLPLFTKQEP